MLGHRLIDDHDERRIGAIVHGEVTAIEQPNVQRTEVVAVGDRELANFSFQLSLGSPSMV